ncbi:hypothetical protein [Streptomyces hoynatensis]|uniref:Uncharacterized protein n=1 Tax=Streptomyces hoynatensis TaxID=1141874 RepID=A0A3A9Z8H4_9ACTN|nr:hypothetical protein [Streptomyces hoynatensis]RKN44802.1 hypothetical protein D7294_06665 [Streptomyces hoynatensis]
MAPTEKRQARRAALWRETAGTVAVIADEAGFARMRRYPTFRFTDHAGYLRQTEAHLRSLAARHGHTSVALFDPEGFAGFCSREGIDPDSPASRSRYTAELATRGATVPYRGQPIGSLLPELLAERLRWETWEAGTALLAAAGSCPGCGAPMPRCAFRRAAALFSSVLELLGPGEHRLVCSLLARVGPLTAAVRIELGPGGALGLAEPEALVVCTVLAAAMATGDPGGLVLRSSPPGGPADAAERGRRDGDGGGEQAGDEVRGWSLQRGRVRPLAEAEVFSAYCTDVRTGDPIPPEPGVRYRPAPTLPTPPCPEP